MRSISLALFSLDFAQLHEPWVFEYLFSSSFLFLCFWDSDYGKNARSFVPVPQVLRLCIFIFQSIFSLLVRLGGIDCSIFQFTNSFLSPSILLLSLSSNIFILVILFDYMFQFLIFHLVFLYTFYFFTETQLSHLFEACL